MLRFLAESEKPCSVCLKPLVLRDFLCAKNTVLNPFIKDFLSLARPAFLAESARLRNVFVKPTIL